MAAVRSARSMSDQRGPRIIVSSVVCWRGVTRSERPSLPNSCLTIPVAGAEVIIPPGAVSVLPVATGLPQRLRASGDCFTAGETLLHPVVPGVGGWTGENPGAAGGAGIGCA